MLQKKNRKRQDKEKHGTTQEGEGKKAPRPKRRRRQHHPTGVEDCGQQPNPQNRRGESSTIQGGEGRQHPKGEGNFLPPFGLWCVLLLAAFSSSFWWCCLPPPLSGGGYFSLSRVGWCCLASSFIGWCWFSSYPLLCGVASLPPPLG